MGEEDVKDQALCRMAEMSLAPPDNGKQGFLETLIHKTNDVGEILREDDSLLRMCFFQILQMHHPKLASKLNVIYALSAAWGQDESPSDFEMLEKKLSELTPDELILVRKFILHLSPVISHLSCLSNSTRCCTSVQWLFHGKQAL